MFLELVALAKEATDDDGNLYLKQWMSADATGCLSSPILELLILGALHYLGRGWIFDDIEDTTGISEKSALFFLSFVCLLSLLQQLCTRCG